MSAITYRFRSRAFRRGLLDGFAAPMFFFAPRQSRRVSEIDGSLLEAWNGVSRALAESSALEYRRIEQAATSAECKREECHAA